MNSKESKGNFTTKGLTELIVSKLSLSGCSSFEECIYDKQHGIYVLCYNRLRCYTCPRGYILPSDRVLHPSQLKLLLDMNSTEKMCHNLGPKADLYCCFAHRGLTTSELDVTLERYLLVNFSHDVMLYSCLTAQTKTLQDILTHNKHDIYYLYDCNTCCQCPSIYVLTTQRPAITTAEWNRLCTACCSPCANGKHLTGTQIICCSLIGTAMITVAHIFDNLSDIMIDHCCLLEIIFEKITQMKNRVLGHVKKATISNFLMQKQEEELYTVKQTSTLMAEERQDMKKYNHEKTINVEEVMFSTSISSLEKKMSTNINCYPDICTRNSDVIHDNDGIAQQNERKAPDISNRRNRRVKGIAQQDRRKAPVISNRRNHRVKAWTLRSGVILLIFMFLSTEARSKIEFDLMTKPSYFGNNVTVYCRMASSSGQSVNHMAWFKNITRQVALNSHSYYPSKYQIAVQNAGDYMYYYLTILRFTVDDVNILYRCDLGFDSHKEQLNLDSNSFIALPKKGTTQKSFNTTNDNLEGFVRILNIYPMPRCEMLYEGHNYTKEVNMTSEQHLVFYNVTLSFALNAKISRCHGVLTISCYFGTRNISILEDEVNFCDDTIEGNAGQYDDIVFITVFMTVGAVCLLISCVYLYIICRRRVGSNCCRIDRNPSGNQEVSLAEPGSEFDEMECMMSIST